jgi:FkbM family methyltransferase
MALLTPGAVAKRLRQFIGPNTPDPDSQPVPEKLATLGDSNTSVVALDYAAHPVRLLATSPMERKWRARSCKKEPWTVAWIEESMGSGGVLYDIGANVGTFSLVAAKVCGRRGTVVAFEPGFASYAHLCGNIVLNRCEAIIIPVPLAVAGASGLGSFRYLSLDPGQSRHDFKQNAWDPNEADTPKRYVQPILSMTLDAVIATFSLPVPNYLKVDVDGGEIDVLQGAAQTLANPALRSILIEIDESQTDTVLPMLDRSGFALARTHKGKHGKDAATRVWYGVFQRKA